MPVLPRCSRRYGLLVHARLHSILLASYPLGGLFPGIALLFSNFYKRHAMHFRFAMLCSFSSLAGAFSGLVAYGIRNLDGKHGIAGWQWIFIVVRSLPLR
jgi:hypothetical protein